MKFYKDIVFTLQEMFKELITRDDKIKNEPVLHLIMAKAESLTRGKDNKDSKDGDSKGKDGKEKTDNWNLVDFTVFVCALWGLTSENIPLRIEIFKYLQQQKFRHLSAVAHRARDPNGDIASALLKDFFNHPEVKLAMILEWLTSYDNKEKLKVELVKLVSEKKPIYNALQDLLELKKSGIVTEDQILAWLAINNINELACRIVKCGKPLAQLIAYLKIIVLYSEPLALPAAEEENIKASLLALFLQVKENEVKHDTKYEYKDKIMPTVLYQWMVKNGVNDYFLITYLKRFPRCITFPAEINRRILANWLKSNDKEGFYHLWSWLVINNENNALFAQITEYLQSNPGRLNDEEEAAIKRAEEGMQKPLTSAPRIRIA